VEVLKIGKRNYLEGESKLPKLVLLQRKSLVENKVSTLKIVFNIPAR